jgi:signal transduction histidine kinase/ActR/RegA family two-component response regulator
MSAPILTLPIVTEGDVVFLRQRCRRTAELLGFGQQDQTRIATAVSEIARNALNYGGGGQAQLRVSPSKPGQRLVISIIDKGPGVADLATILAGRYRSAHGMGVGITGARQLMDRFDIESSSEGTCVTLEKVLPNSALGADTAIARIVERLAADAAAHPDGEVRLQNQELTRALEVTTNRRLELDRVNAELLETNRAMIVLYAELDRRAEQLQGFNDNLQVAVAKALNERDHTESLLRQAQKMEALGQLTGGVAHDFNNLLQVIVGNLEMLSRQLPEDAPRWRRSVSNAMEGAHRAAILTQRLLSFSRLQPLNPKPIDVDLLSQGMFDILRRTLGQQLEMSIQIDPDLWFAEADPHQLENAILNLAVNARHAMVQGGVVVISAHNVDTAASHSVVGLAPADYVAVRVSDTGIGMPPEILERVFEPFFTTKEVGQGTGLGLSQVYGFAKQSRGDVKIESRVGQGTSVTIYLPRSLDRPIEAVVASLGPAMKAAPSETVLVVEDDLQVQNYTVEALTELGYRVQRAGNAAAALELLDKIDRLDLLFTDVILPGGMTGMQLAEQSRKLRPGLRVLFASGYIRDAIAEQGQLAPGVDLLQKPFRYDDLALRVRQALDCPASPLSDPTA